MGAFQALSSWLPDWMLPGSPGQTLAEASTDFLADLPMPGDPGVPILNRMSSDEYKWNSVGDVLGQLGGTLINVAGSTAYDALAGAADIAFDGDADNDGPGRSGGISWTLVLAAAAVAAVVVVPRLIGRR